MWGRCKYVQLNELIFLGASPQQIPTIKLSSLLSGRTKTLSSSKYCQRLQFSSVLFSHSVVSLCDLMDCSKPGLPVHHQLPEFTQTYVHWVSNAIQPSRPLLLLSKYLSRAYWYFIILLNLHHHFTDKELRLQKSWIIYPRLNKVSTKTQKVPFQSLCF